MHKLTFIVPYIYIYAHQICFLNFITKKKIKFMLSILLLNKQMVSNILLIDHSSSV